MLLWIEQHSVLLAWVSVISGLMFVGTLILVPVILIRLPADYFVREPKVVSRTSFAWITWLITRVVKNVLGWIFIFAGFAMLILPGQGVLTILLGISLTDLPFKRKLQHWIITRPRIQKGINWIREKANKPPLVFPDDKK